MGPCPICGTGWGGLHSTQSVFLYGGQCWCVCVMNGIALEQMGGFQLKGALLHFLSAYIHSVHSLFLVDTKLLVYHQISATGSVLVVKGE